MRSVIIFSGHSKPFGEWDLRDSLSTYVRARVRTADQEMGLGSNLPVFR
jgi:hypothetical protein